MIQLDNLETSMTIYPDAILDIIRSVKDMVKVQVINVKKKTSAIDKTNKPSCFSEDLWAIQLANDQI